MKKISIATMIMVLLLSITACHKDAQIPTCPTGAIKGLFSVSDSEQVYFSQGNLQYQASTNTWRFAEHQYDVIGSDNSNISSGYSGWIDLFGWGTSGYNGKHPYMASTNSTDYGNGKTNISGTNYDWGVYNAISNGGNQAGLWRTLTKDEWVYVFNKRNTASGIRYVKACVNGMNGLILLPDYWNGSVFPLSCTNTTSTTFDSNTISSSQWAILEQYGAVFLPAAGGRNGTMVYQVDNGYYWSASFYDSSNAYHVGIWDWRLNPHIEDAYRFDDDPPVWENFRKLGNSVRLVRSAQ